MEEFKIDKGVPIPPRISGKKGSSKHGFDKIAVMDSANFGKVSPAEKTRLTSGAAHHGKMNGKKFTFRSTPEGFRVWRIE